MFIFQVGHIWNLIYHSFFYAYASSCVPLVLFEKTGKFRLHAPKGRQILYVSTSLIAVVRQRKIQPKTEQSSTLNKPDIW
jgi:hypothetical protein